MVCSGHFSSPSTRSMRVFFFSLHCENMVELLELKGGRNLEHFVYYKVLALSVKQYSIT